MRVYIYENSESTERENIETSTICKAQTIGKTKTKLNVRQIHSLQLTSSGFYFNGILIYGLATKTRYVASWKLAINNDLSRQNGSGLFNSVFREENLNAVYSVVGRR